MSRIFWIFGLAQYSTGFAESPPLANIFMGTTWLLLNLLLRSGGLAGEVIRANILFGNSNFPKQCWPRFHSFFASYFENLIKKKKIKSVLKEHVFIPVVHYHILRNDWRKLSFHKLCSRYSISKNWVLLPRQLKQHNQASSLNRH